MNIFLIILLLIIGIVLIVKGGDSFVDAASWVAEALRIPQFIIGATIVSLATTLPEILVSAIAAGQGNADMAVGNAVGSVVANIGLIMGISMLCLPALFSIKDYLAKSLLLIGAIGILYLLCISGSLNVYLSLVLLAVFVAFIVENLLSAKRNMAKERLEKNKENGIREVSAQDENKPDASAKRNYPKKVIVKNVILFIVGAVSIVAGARLLVDYGTEFAVRLGVPSGIIAVTLVAVGTSLPELVTTIVSISKKKSELSVGNIIGANIIDITLILPLCAIISGGALPVGLQSLRLDMPVCLLLACIALIPSLIFKKYRRFQGVMLLSIYAVYITLLVLNVTGVIAIY